MKLKRPIFCLILIINVLFWHVLSYAVFVPTSHNPPVANNELKLAALSTYSELTLDSTLLGSDVGVKPLAKETFKELAFEKYFSASDINRLPIGIKKEIGGVEYAVAFRKAEFQKDFTRLTVFSFKAENQNLSNYHQKNPIGADRARNG